MALRLFYTGSTGVAAALTALAFAQVWASLRVPFLGRVDRYGWEGDGVITLLIGLVALAFATYTWLERRPAAFALIALFTAFLGGLIFATALVNLVDSERAVGAAQSELGLNLDPFLNLQSFVDTGEGVYVAIAAGLLLTVTGAAAFVVARLAPSALALGSSAAAACRRCGGELPAGAGFCPACGAGVGGSEGSGPA